MALVLCQFHGSKMSAKTVASLSLLGPRQHIQYLIDLDTLDEIIYQQNLHLDNHKDCSIEDPVRTKDDSMKGVALN
jgi:hypothetical protein